MNYLPIYILGGVLVLIVAVAVLAHRQQEKRRVELRKTAGRFGFSYSEKPDPSLFSTLSDFNLFRKGFSKNIRNVVRGEMNRIHWTVFDYSYTISTGKSSATYSQTVAYAELKDTSLPRFTLGPESFFHKLGDLVGYRDIDFDNYPRFSDRYQLKGQEEQAIRGVFTPQILSYFETRARPVNIEAEGSRMIIYNLTKVIKPEGMHSFIDESSRIAGIFRKDTF